MAAPISLGEFGRIARFLAPLATHEGALGLRDDAAVLTFPPEQSLVITADAIIEGIHFLGSEPPSQIARKLLRVNLSDLAAMGASPLGYLLTMALPARCDDSWLQSFAEGLGADQWLFELSLFGGDSVSTPGPISLSVTMMGAIPTGGEIRRNGARPGDRIFVSGTIGDGALGLLAARGELSELAPAFRDNLIERYELPQPRLSLGQSLRGIASSMLDISDGLAGDLGHIASASSAAAVIYSDRIPLSQAAKAALDMRPQLFEKLLAGGDDYELLFTVPDALCSKLAQCRTDAKVLITEVGHISSGEGVNVLDAQGRPLHLTERGWRHV